MFFSFEQDKNHLNKPKKYFDNKKCKRKSENVLEYVDEYRIFVDCRTLDDPSNLNIDFHTNQIVVHGMCPFNKFKRFTNSYFLGPNAFLSRTYIKNYNKTAMIVVPKMRAKWDLDDEKYVNDSFNCVVS